MMLIRLPASSVTTIPLERERRFSIRNGNTEEKGRGEIEARDGKRRYVLIEKWSPFL